MLLIGRCQKLRAAQGIALALLVPAGWLTVAAAWGLPMATIFGDPVAFGTFIFATVATFAVFGAWLGRREDELVRRAEELDRLAVTDPLTGLKNVRYFWTRLSEAYATAQRSQEPLSVLLTDVDDFKAVNDRFGHPAGDRLLTEIARAIGSVARAGDTVSRVGGEEFALILPCCDEAGALRVAERLLAEVQGAEVQAGEAPIHATVSVGLASTSALGFLGQHALYERADLALLQAKTAGKNRVARTIPPDAQPSAVQP